MGEDEKKMVNFIERLVRALDNGEIQRKLRTIIGINAEQPYKGDNDSKQKCKKLEEQLEQKNKTIEKLKEELEQKDDTIKQKDTEIEDLQAKEKNLRKSSEAAQNQIKLLEIGKQEKLEQKDSEIKLLEADKREIQRALDEAQSDVISLKASLQQAEQSLGKTKPLTEPFAEIFKFYGLYQGLPDSTRSSLNPIISAATPLSFVVTCANKDNIFAVWDDMKYKLNELSAADKEKLISFLKFCVKLTNLNYSSNVFEVMDTELGEDFDDERHSRGANCSKYQGKIKAVLLPGIWNNNRNIAERKTVVEF